MDRRSFLSLAALAIAGQAVERVFPFRVFSIPAIIPAVPKEVFEYAESIKAKMELLTGVPPTIRALKVHVYSADRKVNRGSFMASMSEGKIIGDIPTGTQPGDILVLEPTGRLSRIHDIGANAHRLFKSGQPRTGCYLSLARS